MSILVVVLPTLYVVIFVVFLMIRRPPRSTRTDTLFPYTTLFRSLGGGTHRHHQRTADTERHSGHHGAADAGAAEAVRWPGCAWRASAGEHVPRGVGVGRNDAVSWHQTGGRLFRRYPCRSEERRVGKEGVSTCITRW